MSLQVFIQGITDTQILTVTHVHVRVPFCALLCNPGCKWSLLEQRMRPLPSISLIKSKLLSLFFFSLPPLSPSHRLYFLLFFVPSCKEWKEWCVIISPLKACSCLGCVLAEWLLVARTLCGLFVGIEILLFCVRIYIYVCMYNIYGGWITLYSALCLLTSCVCLIGAIFICWGRMKSYWGS